MANVNRQLAEAVRKGSLKGTIAALNAGADPNTTYDFSPHLPRDMTVLMMTAGRPENNPEIAEVLITNGADVNATNEGGYTALHYAVSRANVEAVRQLIAAKANLGVRNQTFGYTPLHIAVAGSRTKMVQMLLDAGADTEVKDNRGRTPFDFANQRGLREIAEMFLKREGLESGKEGAKVLSQEANNKSVKGATPAKTQFAPRRREVRDMNAGRRV